MFYISSRLSQMRRTDYEPFICIVVLLIAFFVLSEVIVSAFSTESEKKWQYEFLILMLLLLAYVLGFSNARDRNSDVNGRQKAMPAQTMTRNKNTVFDSGHQAARQAAQAAWRSLPQAHQFVDGLGISMDAKSQEESEEAVNKLLAIKRNEQWEVDMRVIDRAKKSGMAKTVASYSMVMCACNRCNHVEMALNIFNQMLEEGITQEYFMVNSGTASKFFKLLADNLDEKRMRENGLQLIEAIKAHKLMPSTLVQNRLICAWKSKLPDHVLGVFIKLKEEGVSLSSTAYRCIMAAHERTQPEHTLELYEEMVQKGIKLDRVAFNAALCACSHLGMTNQALVLFKQMPQHGLVPNGKTYGTLIKACTATGKMKEALDIFEKMREEGIEPNRFAYHDAIRCCIKVKRLGKAITLYRDMLQDKVPPCDNTFQYLSRACRRRGWTEIADKIVEEQQHARKMEGPWLATSKDSKHLDDAIAMDAQAADTLADLESE